MRYASLRIVSVLILSHLGLLTSLLSPGALGHSHLANPLPTRRLDCRVGNGRPRNCPGPCPPLDTYGKPTGIGPNRPAQAWRRGETRWISWHRNNHGNGESGFVRFTLVPLNKMMDKSAHAKFTFQVSCWSSGLHQCPSRKASVCGNDAEGKAYKVQITVPSAYPDGTYVFGWSWYGGGDFSGEGFFGDYYSCSFVRIQGGRAVSSESKPIFSPGLNTKFRDACVSATDRLGVCYREPCRKGKVRPLKPQGLPRSILSRDLEGNNMNGNNMNGNDDLNRNPGNGQGKGNKRGGEPFNVIGVEVYDIQTRQKRLFTNNSFTIRKSLYPQGFTIGLRVSGNVLKVIFTVRGRQQAETSAPFILNGNDGIRFKGFQCGNREKVSFRALVLARDGARKELQYNFSCV